MWYTLQTSPNYEAKVMEEMNKKIQNFSLPIREIFSPEETIIDFKDGKKRERKKRIYTNYLFIEMDYSDVVWHHVKSIRGVAGFIGNKGNPAVVPESDIAKMKAIISVDVAKPKVSFEAGQIVKITQGAFADFQATVKNVDYDKNKAKLLVVVFNRETEIEVEVNQIERVSHTA